MNAIQRRYPQVYKSTDRLLLKPETIEVGLRDFMISIKSESNLLRTAVVLVFLLRNCPFVCTFFLVCSLAFAGSVWTTAGRYIGESEGNRPTRFAHGKEAYCLGGS